MQRFASEINLNIYKNEHIITPQTKKAFFSFSKKRKAQYKCTCQTTHGSTWLRRTAFISHTHTHTTIRNTVFII